MDIHEQWKMLDEHQVLLLLAVGYQNERQANGAVAVGQVLEWLHEESQECWTGLWELNDSLTRRLYRKLADLTRQPREERLVEGLGNLESVAPAYVVVRLTEVGVRLFEDLRCRFPSYRSTQRQYSRDIEVIVTQYDKGVLRVTLLNSGQVSTTKVHFEIAILAVGGEEQTSLSGTASVKLEPGESRKCNVEIGKDGIDPDVISNLELGRFRIDGILAET